MNLNHRQNLVLCGFLALSLLLHLLLFYLLPQRSLFPHSPPEKPVVVEVRPPQQPKPLERELDIPPRPEPQKPRKTPAKRLGPSNHVAKRETAPKGTDTEDMTPSAVHSPTRRQTQPLERKPLPRARPQPKRRSVPEPHTPVAERPGPARTAEKPGPKAPARKLPDLRALTRVPAQTLARLENKWRRKYRKDVQQGNAVWLDTEKDILISFFRRFRDSIYEVWTYPSESAQKGEQGTCMLRISVNRDGTLKGVKLMESSGYPALDKEAMVAVREAAPYGKLPKAYKEKVLNVFAFFKYNLTRRTIY